MREECHVHVRAFEEVSCSGFLPPSPSLYCFSTILLPPALLHSFGPDACVQGKKVDRDDAHIFRVNNDNN